jgi:hypothetical protein
MCQFFLNKGIDIVVSAVSVFIGFKLGVWHETKKEKKLERQKRQELLRELSKTLNDNLGYLEQITNLHAPKKEIPTFFLDTVWLHYFTSSASHFIPEVSGYREKYNKLRFELDHINQKIVLAHQLGFSFMETHVLPHVEQAKVWIKSELEVLKKLNR